jgi:hypothetical protein
MRTKNILTVLCSLTAAAAIAMSGPQAAAYAASGQGAPVTPACGWHGPYLVTDNVPLGDSAAAYWLMPFTVQDGLRIVLDGRYPDSRYTSLQVYSSGTELFSTNGVSSALADYRIDPDPSSVNPWQHAAGRAGDAYTVTLQSDVAPGRANVLPLAPAGTAAGTAGYLQYRVYLPARGDFSRIPVPKVTFTLDGVSTRVPACPPPAPITAAPAAPLGAAAAPAAATSGAAAQGVEFAGPVLSGAGFPNADSGYLLAVVTTPPADGDVLVIRGKAPTAARGSHPSPWPARGVDVQYWSLCDYLGTALLPLVANRLPDGAVDYGCRYDSQVTLDHGYYTFVVGTEAQRAAIGQIPGATFLPFSAAYPTTAHVLVLRNMLVNPGFAEAVQNVPGNGNPASAAAVMGPYYPRTAICPLATLASGGPAACLAR